MEEYIIKGLWGCCCHPFASWDECDKMQKQKFTPGEKIKNRCTGKLGEIISKDIDTTNNFWIVKYGKKPKDIHVHHASMLLKINN